MDRITKTGPKGLELIKKYEGFRSKPYLCSAGVPTIGYGSTYYTDGSRVKLQDPRITNEEAEKLLMATLGFYEKSVDSFTRDDITQNQFDALVSFCYNLGPGNLKISTLLKKVNMNPDDVTIRKEFLKWTKAAGKVLAGLVARRTEEADLYFS